MNLNKTNIMPSSLVMKATALAKTPKKWCQKRRENKNSIFRSLAQIFGSLDLRGPPPCATFTSHCKPANDWKNHCVFKVRCTGVQKSRKYCKRNIHDQFLRYIQIVHWIKSQWNMKTFVIAAFVARPPSLCHPLPHNQLQVGIVIFFNSLSKSNSPHQGSTPP